MADDWGCNVELFGESKNGESSTKSLTELVDLLSKKNMNGQKKTESVNVVSFHPNGATNKISMIRAPKILKKKKTNNINNNNNKILNETNVKRVTFEIEQLLSREAGKDDRDKARERILTSLGAAAPKRDYVNYKTLKTELAAKKAREKLEAEMHSANSLSMTTIKKKKNKKK
ncbi:unnamed protein product [Caenorhabditis bovis]|uniref:Uncharacterized protein n=1 Tax=Caenorhabditis bovis TaxID=2654633 RepID=A0A8S1ERA0_9PELO|nr:unnamed protein product [Caenorhabditis bovis]